ncbi:hypothetical protein BDZ97DRAFT_1917934 [Flammula alnicola]|nr:hypothetical protein BDZ97DRAFT_1917934 [Flammula alnicola]
MPTTFWAPRILARSAGNKDGCVFKSPPLDGSLTIPDIFNWHVVNRPSHPVFIYEYDEGIANLPFSAVVPAVDRAARYVASIGDGNVARPPVAILAITDTSIYFCISLGMILAGIPSFPISPRNPPSSIAPSSIAHLLYTTKVHHILVSDDSNLEEIARKSIAILENDGHEPPVLASIPHSVIFFTDVNMTSLLETRFTQQTHDYESPVVYVHSSGPSSLPEPIPWNHASLLQVALTHLGAFDLRGEICGAHAVPMFHGSGLNFIPWVAGAGFTMVIFSPTTAAPTLPMPENVSSIIFLTSVWM